MENVHITPSLKIIDLISKVLDHYLKKEMCYVGWENHMNMKIMIGSLRSFLCILQENTMFIECLHPQQKKRMNG